MRLVLHIGTDKAGSTAIQTHLFLNRAWLRSRGTCVPENCLGFDNGHSALFASLDEDKLVATVDELHAARAEGSRQAVLSWEGLCFYPAKAIARLAEAFDEFDTRIILYLREQADIIQSGFLQELKRLNNSCSITIFQTRRLIYRYNQQPRERFPVRRDYYRLARRWEKAFPAPEMCIRLFQPEALEQGDAVTDFFTLLGHPPDSDFLRPRPVENPSLDAESGFVIDHLQQLGCPRDELQRLVDVALSSILQDGGGEKYFLDRDTVEKIRRHFDRSNRRLAKRYLGASGNPFDLDKTCWSSRGEAAIRERLIPRMRELFVLDQLVSFGGQGLAGADIAAAGLLAEGWAAPESWGSWCDGRRSRIRFRLLLQEILPEHTHIHIYIRGRYRDEDAQTTVRINGREFGPRRLGHDQPGLDLPLAELGKYQGVEIELLHHGEFGLEFFGYEHLPLTQSGGERQ